jgi:hypothetical protein
MKNPKTIQTLTQAGFIRQVKLLVVLIITIAIAANVYKVISNDKPLAVQEIRSALGSYCIDDYHNAKGSNVVADTKLCNGRQSQSFIVAKSTIRHGTDQCIDVFNNGDNQGDKVDLNTCDGRASQQWSIDLGGLENTKSGLCLTVPGGNSTMQLTINQCNDLSSLNVNWASDHWSNPDDKSINCNTGTKGEKVACYAQQQWLSWESNPSGHTALLSLYSDGNGYEEWCADFVSYVYKEAGYPFTAGERDGWDEINANNIQYMGFTKHPAAGYDSQPGDVAFFDYPGGHVEIVKDGGAHPTFIYGDAGATDPDTDNGEMNRDTLTNDGSAGQVTYYLSPN